MLEVTVKSAYGYLRIYTPMTEKKVCLYIQDDDGATITKFTQEQANDFIEKFSKVVRDTFGDSTGGDIPFNAPKEEEE